MTKIKDYFSPNGSAAGMVGAAGQGDETPVGEPEDLGTQSATAEPAMTNPTSTSTVAPSDETAPAEEPAPVKKGKGRTPFALAPEPADEAGSDAAPAETDEV